MRTEVFSEDGVVGFADFTSLVMYGRMVSMCGYSEEDREEDELQFSDDDDSEEDGPEASDDEDSEEDELDTSDDEVEEEN